jgi:hypothetical protein
MKILVTETSVRSESAATWSRLAPTEPARQGEYPTPQGVKYPGWIGASPVGART